MNKNLLKTLLLAFGISFSLISPAQLNLTFKSKLSFAGSLSNIWGYAAGGKEYALVGHQTGMTVVDVTDPSNPVSLFNAPGPNSIWREVRTKGTYAFVTTEATGVALQIVNLAYLPDSIVYKSWTGNGAIAGQLSTIHALQVDGNYLYLYGSNIENANNNGHPIIMDVSDPWNPNYVGSFVFPGGGSVSYVHDGYVRNDTGYFGHILDGFFSIVDLSDKANPVLLASQNTPGNFTHNSWLSDNSKILFTTDEVDNSYLTSYDVTDPTDIKELDKIQQNPGSNSVIHNTYIINDFAVTSWYKEGVVIVDASRPDNLVITGYYDTSPLSGGGMDGDWGVYPFLPSGNLLISDMQEGMFVLTPEYKRGCFLEGTITETGSGNPVFGAIVSILTTSETSNSKSNGSYACGYGIAGTYDVKVQKTGYVTKTITGVSLTNGNIYNLNVQLDPAVSFTLSGLVKDNSTSSVIPNAEVVISTSLSSYSVTADANGFFSLPTMYSDTYEIAAGKWGYVTRCFQQYISSSSGGLVIDLEQGYYDDFSFDFGWTITSNGATAGFWEIGDPAGTSYNGVEVNPDSDNNSDCNDWAFITGNGGGSPGDDDLDGGKTTITSPVFDISAYGDAYLSYERWFYNGGGYTAPNDSMKIKITNGTLTVVMEDLSSNSLDLSVWVSKSYKVSDYISITPSMRIIVEAADFNPGNLVEGGFDLFRITKSPLGQVERVAEKESVQIFPNPSDGLFEVRLDGSSEYGLEVYNMLGDMITKLHVSGPVHRLNLQKQPPGVYFVNIITDSSKQTIRLIRL